MAVLIKNPDQTFSYGCTTFTVQNLSEPVLYNVFQAASRDPRGSAALELWAADVAMEADGSVKAIFGIAGGFMFTDAEVPNVK